MIVSPFRQFIIIRDSAIMNNHLLDNLLSPSSLALVGASPKKHSNGLAMYEMCKIDGYQGEIFLVNPIQLMVDIVHQDFLRSIVIDDCSCHPIAVWSRTSSAIFA